MSSTTTNEIIRSSSDVEDEEYIKNSRPYVSLIKALIRANFLEAPYKFTTEKDLLEKLSEIGLSVHYQNKLFEMFDIPVILKHKNRFEQLNNYPDYEISINYPYRIRKIKNHVEVPTFINNGGYIALTLNHETKLLHRIIAEHFIDNPNGYNIVDHIDRDKKNNHLDNLRWVPPKTSVENRDSFKKQSKKEYLSELPENVFKIDKYEGFEFDRYWFDVANEKVITFNKGKYRYLTITNIKNSKSINMKDINNVNHAFGMLKMTNHYQKKALKRLCC